MWCSQADVLDAACSTRLTGRRVLSSVHRIGKFGTTRAMPASNESQGVREPTGVLATTSCMRLDLLLSE